jgi:hypothetical protein
VVPFSGFKKVEGAAMIARTPSAEAGEEKTSELYRALLGLCHGQIVTRFGGAASDVQIEDGRFVVNLAGTDPRRGPAVAVAGSLCDLAHQFSHVLSFMSGSSRDHEWLRPRVARALREPTEPILFDWEKATWLDEELRAWRMARELLQRRGFEDWAEFERAEEHGLEIYRRLPVAPYVGAR